jgi:hypothetical protein
MPSLVVKSFRGAISAIIGAVSRGISLSDRAIEGFTIRD